MCLLFLLKNRRHYLANPITSATDSHKKTHYPHSPKDKVMYIFTFQINTQEYTDYNFSPRTKNLAQPNAQNLLYQKPLIYKNTERLRVVQEITKMIILYQEKQLSGFTADFHFQLIIIASSCKVKSTFNFLSEQGTKVE